MANLTQCIYEAQDMPSTATSLYTASTGTYVTVTKASCVNHDAAAQQVSFWIGASAIDARLILDAATILPGGSFDVSPLRAQTLNPGDSIWGQCSASGAVSLRINAQVVTN